ncbi:hypothetical protein MHTCC0001_31440 [Flavobacteriaceae bacterium MHTCC 0001]
MVLRYFKLGFLFALCAVKAQQLPPPVQFEEIFTADDDGMQSWENLDIFTQDEDGIFWTAINEGVFRYNGHSALNVSAFLSTKYGLELDSQTNTRVLKSGNILWVGRRKSLVKVDLKQFTKKEIQLDTALHAANYRNLILRLKSQNDTLYVGTGNGLYLVNETTNTVLKKYLNNGVAWNHTASSNGVESIHLDVEKNAIWLALNSGLYRIDKTTDSVQQFTFPDKTLKFKHHFLDGHRYGDDLLFTCWGTGMVKFNLKTKAFKVIQNQPPKGTIWSKSEYWSHNIVRSEVRINDSISLVNFQRLGNAYFNRNTESFTYIDAPKEMKQGIFINIDRNGYFWGSKIGRLWRSKAPVVAVHKPIQPIIDIYSFKADNILTKVPSIEGYDTIELGEERQVDIAYTLTNTHVFDTIYYQYKLNKKDWKPVKEANKLSFKDLGGKMHTLSIRAFDKKDRLLAERALTFRINIPFYNTTIFYTLCALLLFIIAFLISQFIQNKKTTKKILELDSIKSNFFANISHEFRTPLTLITNPIEVILQDDKLTPEKREQFEIAKRNSDRLLELVNQLLDLSKIDAGELKLKIRKGSIKTLISGILASFNYSAVQKHITYNTTININEQDAWFDADALHKIIINLVSNAIKYTPEYGTIHCNVSTKKERLYFNIKNTGNTLQNEELDKIFTRFYQNSEDTLGTGIGLALVKELVTLHKGEIRVQSEPNEWIQFSLALPVNKSSFKGFIMDGNDDKFRIFESKRLPKNTSEINDVLLDNSSIPILLIVEDNADIRELLYQTFSGAFSLLFANNGKEGFNKAMEYIPDIIISDVMMPVMDGLKLTNHLKTNELTSHIPVILLTAKAGDENELTGIETGADDYITKPFNTQLLKTKVANLIDIRQKLHKRYSQEVMLAPKNFSANPLDEQFLNKIHNVFDTKLNDPSFTVEDFSRLMGVSRMQLHRKIKALTGLSTSAFIRSQRLKQAAELLKQPEVNIAQIGYTVGFNDHSYFTKCFREVYKCTPKEYSKT